MRCSKIKLISPYIDGELSGEEKDILELHMNECRECAQELEDLRKIRELFTGAETFKASYGFSTRVAIARALANNAKLILADEPAASLDTGRGTRVMELLKRIAKENRSAVIVVTHDVRMIEGFDHVCGLKDGRIIEEKRNSIQT